MLKPWNATASPEIMAGALQESKRGVLVPFYEGQAAGQLPALSARAVPRWPSGKPATGLRRRSARAWNGRSQSEA